MHILSVRSNEIISSNWHTELHIEAATESMFNVNQKYQISQFSMNPLENIHSAVKTYQSKLRFKTEQKHFSSSCFHIRVGMSGVDTNSAHDHVLVTVPMVATRT